MYIKVICNIEKYIIGTKPVKLSGLQNRYMDYHLL